MGEEPNGGSGIGQDRPEAARPERAQGARPEAARAASGGTAAGHVPYQRKHPQRRTQPAIDDLAQDGSLSESYTHDSNVTIRGGGLSGREYRRSRSTMPQLQRSVQYGQYLEVPKGRRAIFAPAERKRRRNSIIAAVAVAAAFVIVALIVHALLG